MKEEEEVAINEKASPYTRLGLSIERHSDLVHKLGVVTTTTPNIIDVVDWIDDNFEGKDRDALFIMYGMMLEKNERRMKKVIASQLLEDLQW